MVHGSQYTFTLDTGTPTTQVICDETTIHWATDRSVGASGVLGTSEVVTAVLPNLTMGQVARYDLPVSLVPPTTPGARNLLGLDVLAELVCEFDFPSAELRLGSDVSTSDHDLVLGDAGHVYLDLTWPDAVATAVWDTGASITVFDQGFIHRHAELFTPVGTSVGTDASGTSQATPTYLVAAFEVGGVLIDSHCVAGVDLSFANKKTARRTDLILGFPALRQAIWLFDFKGRRWSVKRT